MFYVHGHRTSHEQITVRTCEFNFGLFYTVPWYWDVHITTGKKTTVRWEVVITSPSIVMGEWILVGHRERKTTPMRTTWYGIRLKGGERTDQLSNDYIRPGFG